MAGQQARDSVHTADTDSRTGLEAEGEEQVERELGRELEVVVLVAVVAGSLLPRAGTIVPMLPSLLVGLAAVLARVVVVLHTRLGEHKELLLLGELVGLLE